LPLTVIFKALPSAGVYVRNVRTDQAVPIAVLLALACAGKPDEPVRARIVDADTLADLGAPAHTEVAPGLYAVYSRDGDAAALHAEAVAGLDRAADPFDAEPFGAGAWVVADDDVAATLLLSERWEALDASVPGDLVVWIPGKDLIFFAHRPGEADVEGLTRAAEAAWAESAAPISTEPYRWTPGGWEKWTP
jgi:hypothetical protein